MAQLRTICNEMDPTRPYHDPDPECIAQRHGPHSYEWNQHYRTYNTGYPLTAGPDNPLEWTEYGASGAASVETLERIMPAEHLWPIRSSDPYWTWHKAFGAYGADNWMGSRSTFTSSAICPTWRPPCVAASLSRRKGCATPTSRCAVTSGTAVPVPPGPTTSLGPTRRTGAWWNITENRRWRITTPALCTRPWT